jgi:hypothetical protein
LPSPFSDRSSFTSKVSFFACSFSYKKKKKRYHITPYSLYGAVSVGLKTDTILSDLARLCKTELPERVVETIRQCTQSYGKAKLVLHQNRYFIECAEDDVLQMLLRDPKIGASRVTSSFTLPPIASATEKSFAPALGAASAIPSAASSSLVDVDLELVQPVLESNGGAEVGEDEDDLIGANGARFGLFLGGKVFQI